MQIRSKLKDWWLDLAWPWQVTVILGVFLALTIVWILIPIPGRILPRDFRRNLAASAFGAGLGVLLAFHLHELRTKRRRERERAVEQARLGEMLDALRREIERLTEEADELSDEIRSQSTVYEDPELYSSTWHAHRERVLGLEDRPSVRRDLVDFYEHVEALRRLVHLYHRSWGLEIRAPDIEAATAEVRRAEEESRHPGGEQARSLLSKQIRDRGEVVVELGSELLNDWPDRISLLQGPSGWVKDEPNS